MSQTPCMRFEVPTTQMYSKYCECCVQACGRRGYIDTRLLVRKSCGGVNVDTSTPARGRAAAKTIGPSGSKYGPDACLYDMTHYFEVSGPPITHCTCWLLSVHQCLRRVRRYPSMFLWRPIALFYVCTYQPLEQHGATARRCGCMGQTTTYVCTL